MSMFHYGFMQVPYVPNQPKTAEIPAKTHPKCIKNAHRGNHKLKNLSGEIPRTPLTTGGIPPLVLSPTRAFGTRSDFRRTTFKYVATGLLCYQRNKLLKKANSIYTDIHVHTCTAAQSGFDLGRIIIKT